MVFDVRTGVPTYLNPEAQLVVSLFDPDQTPSNCWSSSPLAGATGERYHWRSFRRPKH